LRRLAASPTTGTNRDPAIANIFQSDIRTGQEQLVIPDENVQFIVLFLRRPWHLVHTMLVIGGPQGAKPKAEVVADILALLNGRRA